jgi:predicted dehydrogenase
MDRIRIGLVGCGGMGTRHLYGMRELRRTGLANADVVAVCDPRQENAELAASEAERLFDRRPEVFASVEEMAERCRGLDAADVVTEPHLHHAVACAALERGLHVMVEKPMGLTVRACRRMIEAAARHDRRLSVNENYRRDPVNRLIRQVIDRGLIGRPYQMVHHSVGGGDRIVITPWRHLKERGGITLDVGVHFADIILYYLGDAASVFGSAEVVREVRRRPANPNRPYEFHRRRLAEMEETVRPTAEDVSAATVRMASGATVDWRLDQAAKRMGYFRRAVYGTKGAVDCPGERNGRPATLHLEDRERPLVGREILEVLPDFELDPVTSALFGKRAVEYSFSPDEADLKILALEYHEFAEAVLNDRPPEVDGIAGLKAVALIYAILESSVAGTSLRVEDVEAGKVDAYQREIDEAIGL